MTLRASERVEVIGTTVGKYDVLEEIGRGGMGVVYLARQRGLERLVALKALHGPTSLEGGPGKALVQESRMASSLNHPNVVTVYEYLEEDGIPYVAMEYVPRGSLRPWIGCMSLAQLAGALEDLLAGLAAVAPSGIVHRDLKPENVMVSADGRVKIADFGIAKATQRAGGDSLAATPTGITVGTPAYMAPEQALCEPVGPWTDLYSVGIITYEHLVGQVPFRDAGTPMAIMLRHINDVVPAPADVDPRVDRPLSDWVTRLLVKDPAFRTRSAAAAWDELEEIVIGQLGPMWRRDARLTERARTRVFPRRLDPEQFTSQRFTVEAIPDADPVIATAPMETRTAPVSPTLVAGERGASQRRRRRPRARRWLLVAAGTGAVAAGVAVAQTGGPAATATVRRAQAGPVTVSLPPQWDPASPGEVVAGYQMPAPLTAIPADARGAITLGLTSAVSAALLPPGLIAAGHPLPKAEQVTLGGSAFFRYRDSILSGSLVHAVIYTQPTTAGVLVAACRLPAAGFATVNVGCEQILGTTTVRDAKAVPLAQGERYLAMMTSAITTLDVARSQLSPRLAAASNARAQGRSAALLQGAARAAAGRLRSAAPGPSEAKTNDALVGSLEQISSGYGQMARAAQGEAARLYRQGATLVVSASATLAAVLRSFSASG